MGLSGSKTTTQSSSSTTPVYGTQITGAADNLTNTYNANKANTQSIQDNLSSLIGTATSNYNNNSTLNAAKNYVTSTLGGSYSVSPYLSSILAQTNADTANTANASLGTRGLAGGSVAAKTIADQVSKNANNLLYTDYNNYLNRQANAASLAPSLSSADATNLSSLLGLSSSASNLSTDQATKYAAAINGLLGQYTNSTGTNTTSSSPSLGSILGSILSSASSIASLAGG